MTLETEKTQPGPASLYICVRPGRVIGLRSCHANRRYTVERLGCLGRWDPPGTGGREGGGRDVSEGLSMDVMMADR